MSFQEKNITVSLMSGVLILVYFLINWIQMYRVEGLNQGRIFALWITVGIAMILVNILGTIITTIALAIVHAIRTGSDKPERLVEDERDKLIELKGSKVGYIIAGIGGFFAMLSFVLGQPALVMFSLLTLFGIVSGIAGDISQLVLYRRGF